MAAGCQSRHVGSESGMIRPDVGDALSAMSMPARCTVNGLDRRCVEHLPLDLGLGLLARGRDQDRPVGPSAVWHCGARQRSARLMAPSVVDGYALVAGTHRPQHLGDRHVPKAPEFS